MAINRQNSESPMESDISKQFFRACDKNDHQKVKSMFPLAYGSQEYELPRVSSFLIADEYIKSDKDSKLGKFLKKIFSQLVLKSTAYEQHVLSLRENWEILEDHDEDFITELISNTSVGHWLGLDSNGESSLGTLLRFEYIDAFWTLIKELSVIPYPETVVHYVTDTEIGQIVGTMIPFDEIPNNKYFERAKEVQRMVMQEKDHYYIATQTNVLDIIYIVRANGWNSFYNHKGRDGTTYPMGLSEDIDIFNKEVGHLYDYGIQDNEGNTLLFYNFDKSTIDRMTVDQLLIRNNEGKNAFEYY